MKQAKRIVELRQYILDHLPADNSRELKELYRLQDEVWAPRSEKEWKKLNCFWPVMEDVPEYISAQQGDRVPGGSYYEYCYFVARGWL